MVKLLCLHGFGTSAAFMEFQTRNWKKAFKNLELEYMNGTDEVPDAYIVNSFVKKFHKDIGSPMYSNFPLLRNYNDIPKDEDPIFEDVKELMIRICDILNKEKNFDGFMGFSQGTYVIYCFYVFLEKGYLKPYLNVEVIPHCAILVSPFPGHGIHLVKAKSLHFFGVLDEVFPMCEQTLLRYRKPKAIYTQDGHKFPAINQKVKETMKEFLDKISEETYRKLINYDENIQKL